MKRLDISEINVEWFICFYKWLLDVKQLKSHNIAMIGISYGGGIMLKAYLKLKEFLSPPNILMTHGTYADAESTLRFLLTGEILKNGVQIKITPHKWGLIVIFQNYLKNLELDWDISGVQEVLGLEVQEKFYDRDKVLNKLKIDDPLLNLAKELEALALKDEYFISRGLYPNVDFYSGIIYRAMGIPTNMFTVMFALGRLPGWLAHWKEMINSPDFRINRPRQIYTGYKKRNLK